MPAIRTVLAALAMLALGASMPAFGACEVDIESNDMMQFNKDAIEVDASCDSVTINLEHTGQLPASAMGHNWVLTKKADFQSVAQAGASAGLDNDYLPPDDDRVIAATEIIGGGESTSVTFSIADLNPDESYQFFCSFPGHWAAMNGAFRIK